MTKYTKLQFSIFLALIIIIASFGHVQNSGMPTSNINDVKITAGYEHQHINGINNNFNIKMIPIPAKHFLFICSIGQIFVLGIRIIPFLISKIPIIMKLKILRPLKFTSIFVIGFLEFNKNNIETRRNSLWKKTTTIQMKENAQ